MNDLADRESDGASELIIDEGSRVVSLLTLGIVLVDHLIKRTTLGFFNFKPSGIVESSS